MEITSKQENSNNSSFGNSKLDEVESTRIQMKRVREENTNLKKQLEQIENDYKSLQMRVLDIVQQQQSHQKSSKDEVDTEEPELVSLRLGRSPRDENTSRSCRKKRGEDGDSLEDGLKLGLDCSFIKSPVRDVLDEVKNENKKENEAGESWPPSKSPKTVRSGDDEPAQPSVKRARVSVRARCDQPTLNDGCQWRKYGQKIAKGNPCPRAYYRCTMADSCPVRKQVQRCADEMSILITTYEGTHNHPLPGSATAMTSFTSAAASMLLSGSSTSSSIIPPTNLLAIGGASGLNILNPYENSRTRMSFPSFPNSQHNFPTITLDLTTPNSSISPPHFNLFSPSASLNFSSPESNMLPSIWNSGYQNYGTQQQAFGSLNFPRPTQEASYQSYMESIKNHATSNTQHALVETLTKAINNDPSVRSVIEKMVSSMVSAESSEVKKCGTSFLNRSSSLSSQNGSLKLQQPPLASSNSSSRSTIDNRDQTNS